MNTAAIYTRVSTEEQKQHGISLDAQIIKCQKYAVSCGLQVVYTGIEGESAKDTDRPELQLILKMIAQKKIIHLIVVKLDRLSRDVEDGCRIGKMLAKKGVQLHLVTEGGAVDLSDPSQEMLFHMRIALARFERRRIGLNTKMALTLKKERDERYSRYVQIGKKLDSANPKKLLDNPKEQKMLEIARLERQRGTSYNKITKILSAMGYKNREGNPYNMGTVFKMLKA